MNQMPLSRRLGLSTNRLIVLAAVGLGFGCAGCLLLIGAFSRPARSGEAFPMPVFTVVALPTQTSTPISATVTPPGMTPTPAPTLPSGGGEGFAPGDLVEVYGTGGDGLRLRRAPNLDADIVVLGVESEVFRVIAGPTSANGYSWWQLVNPYDSGKQGWAVGLYLRKLGSTP